MGDGADQDRNMTDNHLYAALLDNASANSADEQNIKIIDCQKFRSDQMGFAKITKVVIVTNIEVGDCLNYTANMDSDF